MLVQGLRGARAPRVWPVRWLHGAVPNTEQKPDEKKGEEKKKTEEKSFKLDRRVWAPAASSLLIGSGVGIIIPLLPMFARDIGITPGQFGLVVSAFGASRLLSNFPASWAAERFGRRPLMLGGPLVSGAAMMSVSLATSFPELFASRFLAGAGGAFFMSATQLYLADISAPENRARTMAPLYAAFGVGTTVGPAIGGMLGASFGLNAPFVFVGASMLSASALNYFTVRETKPPLLPAEVAAATSRGMAGELKETWRQWKSILSLKSVRSVLALNTCFWMVHTGTQMSIVPFILSDTFGFSVYNLGTVFAMSSLINVIGAQPAAWVADKFGRKTTIVPGVTIVCGCLASLPFITQAEHMVALQALWALGACMLGTSPLAYVVDATPTSMRAQSMAMFRSSGDLGLLLGGALMGFLTEAMSLHSTTAVATSVLAVAGLNFVRNARQIIAKE